MNRYNPLKLITDRYLGQPGRNPSSSSFYNKPLTTFINKDECNCPNKKIEIYWEQGIGRVIKYLCPCLQKENLIQEKNPLEEIHPSEESNLKTLKL